MVRSAHRSILASAAILAAATLLAVTPGTTSVMAAAPAAGAPAAAPAPAGLKVFYASHSLMWDMFPVLTELATAYGIKGHEVVGDNRLGVSRTSQHWDQPDAQNKSKNALRTGKIDAFVMSPIGMPDEGITNFVKLGLEHNPKMKFYVQVSWPGMGLVDNNDMGNGAGGLGGRGAPGGAPGGRGAPGGAPGGFPGRGAPGATPGGAPGAAPAAPAAPGAMVPFADDALFFVGAPAAPAAPGAGGPPSAGRGAPGGRGGFGGAPGGFGGFGGGGQNYNKTAEELAQINVRNDKSAEEQAAKINAELGKGETVIYLIPTSQAHNMLRLAILKMEIPVMTDQGEVFTDAIGHPTAPVIAMNAYLHFAVLYNRSPIGLPMPGVLKRHAKYNDENLNAKLQQIAWDSVKNYKPSGVTAK